MPISHFLSFLQNAPDNPARLILLTGPSGAGKTSWCQETVARLRAASRTTAGLLSPPVWADGRKAAIDLLAVHTGERRRLAAACQPGEGDPATPNWRFDPAAIAWGNQVLRRLPACDCFFLDELGPLEFRAGQGLQAGFDLLDQRAAPLSFVVARVALLPAAVARWPWAEILPLPGGVNLSGLSNLSGLPAAPGGRP